MPQGSLLLAAGLKSAISPGVNERRIAAVPAAGIEQGMQKNLKIMGLRGWALAAGFTLLAGAAVADPAYPLGSRIGLEPPAGMTLNPANNQFEDTANKTTVTLLDLPLHLYGEMERMVFAEINKPGVTILKRESLPYANGIGYFIAVELTHEGKKYRKWLLLAQSNANPVPDLAALVSVQAPEEAFAVYSDEIARKALASVTFRPAPNEERLKLMPFAIGDLAGFEIAEVAPVGVILTDKPQRGGQPELVISMGQGAPLDAQDRPNFSRDLLQRGPISSLEILSADAMRIGSMPGFEIQARAIGPNGAPIRLVQWLRFSGGNYLRIIGGSSTQEWDQAFPRMRAVRDGVTVR
ncbi:MAG: hypothetical protein JO245_06790 [Pseudolabrys sp.]|nr:hypothetical protein [Pseudolabrys sp.]